MSKISRLVYMICGFILLGLGVLGVILPIMPHTVFLLGAAVCFTKSSEKIDTWFKGTKLYRDNLEGFASGQGMTIATKTRVIVLLTFFFGLAFFFMRSAPNYAKIILLVVWLCHVIGFIFFVKDKEEVLEEITEG